MRLATHCQHSLGEPAWTEELESQLQEGTVILGGCCIEGDDPCWECQICGHQF